MSEIAEQEALARKVAELAPKVAKTMLDGYFDGMTASVKYHHEMSLKAERHTAEHVEKRHYDISCEFCTRQQDSLRDRGSPMSQLRQH